MMPIAAIDLSEDGKPRTIREFAEQILAPAFAALSDEIGMTLRAVVQDGIVSIEVEHGQLDSRRD